MVIAGAASGEGDLPLASTSDYLPRPRWLETLIVKFSSQSSAPLVARPLPPLGSFAAFLSCCVTEQIDCTRSEEAALHEVSPPLPLSAHMAGS